MARERIFRDVENVECEFFWLPPETAVKIAARLTKLIMEPLGVGLAAAATAAKAAKAASASNVVEGAEAPARAEDLANTEFPVDALSKALSAMSDRIGEAEVWDTCKTMLLATQVKFPGDGGTRKVNINVDFEGRPGLLLKIVYAALEVNFSDFFGESSVVGQLVAQATAKARANFGSA